MGPIDFIVIGIVLLVVALAAWYVIRTKKNGAKCIGCPSSCNCSKSQNGQGNSSCACCCGCGDHGASMESAEESAEAPSAEDEKN